MLSAYKYTHKFCPVIDTQVNLYFKTIALTGREMGQMKKGSKIYLCIF